LKIFRQLCSLLAASAAAATVNSASYQASHNNG
jgi:hypothetical protein